MDKLLAMRLVGIAEALQAQEKGEQTLELSFAERLALLVDQQFSWRQNQALILAPATGQAARRLGRGHRLGAPPAAWTKICYAA